MPEQLTRHPDVTLQVLKSAGAQCGAGAAQEILKTCPPARFCKLPGGEICVYGIPDAPRMTQFGAADWRALAVATKVPGVASLPASTVTAGGAEAPAAVAALGSGVGLVAVGVAIGWWLRRPR
jgi:hypothetical protein